MVKKKKSDILMKCIAYLVLIIVSLTCLLPFIMVLSASFSSESLILKEGYSVFPRGFTFDVYKLVFENSKGIVSAYATTIFVTVVGGITAILMTSMAAYTIARPDYEWRKQISFYLYFTMLFNGGAISSYILISQYLKLRNTIAVLIVPLLINVWNLFLLRTYFSKIHMSLIESAKIDGANEFYIFVKIVMPISKTGIVTVLLLVLLQYWNDWYLSLMYMTNDKIISLQYMLYKMMSSVEYLSKNTNSGMVSIDTSVLPAETVKMAVCVLAAGPMVFVFMFFQKYFAKGIMVGSVKG